VEFYFHFPTSPHKTVGSNVRFEVLVAKVMNVTVFLRCDAVQFGGFLPTLLPPCSALKVEPAGISKISITMCQITRRHVIFVVIMYIFRYRYLTDACTRQNLHVLLVTGTVITAGYSVISVIR
jgi:hypothetical protein